jgi:hypothetical protein
LKKKKTAPTTPQGIHYLYMAEPPIETIKNDSISKMANMAIACENLLIAYMYR